MSSSKWARGRWSSSQRRYPPEVKERAVRMVAELWAEGPAGHGVIARVARQLVAGRPEPRATLLAEPDNHTANTAYADWGWHTVAQLRPSWDNAPLYNVLIRPTHTRG